ncbi:hypothetical protein PL373_18955 [Tenacibaculum maritimum]|nr:hypothetical protein [Tenacibaculum maritimum]MDB0603168.1 hypothetical protein [Tenacibaculum maritimum]MDB0610431.1 hypothetical protein [Tenacibaculum maritimum]
MGGQKNEKGLSSKQESNAKLIAVAPDLLKALIGLVDEISPVFNEVSNNKYNKAIRAIDKALK